MARTGAQITWTVKGPSAHWGLVINGEVKHNATKLIVVPESQQFDTSLAVQFPTQIRSAGTRYVVDRLELAEGKTHYRVVGNIKKLVQA